LIYADSSFLVSLYLRDANSEAARSEMKLHAAGVGLSRIAGLEVRNAFRLAVFRGWITSLQEARIQALLATDLKGGFLLPLSFAIDEVFAESERLSEQHTSKSGNRSLDVLHVACAQVADLKIFASFDGRQRKLAESTGLRLAPA
jgi:predicted nucleic acid-binding protein